MKRSIVFIFSLLLSLTGLSLWLCFAFVVSAIAQEKMATCSSCQEMEELRRQFDSIDYADPQARARAQKDLVPKALMITDKLVFTKPAPSVSAPEIRALVQLIASETPYDVESAGAGHLAILIKRHKMQSVYAEELKKVPEKCRRETLAYYAGGRLCSGEACKKLKPPKNFEDCLLETKSAQ